MLFVKKVKKRWNYLLYISIYQYSLLPDSSTSRPLPESGSRRIWQFWAIPAAFNHRLLLKIIALLLKRWFFHRKFIYIKDASDKTSEDINVGESVSMNVAPCMFLSTSPSVRSAGCRCLSFWLPACLPFCQSVCLPLCFPVLSSSTLVCQHLLPFFVCLPCFVCLLYALLPFALYLTTPCVCLQVPLPVYFSLSRIYEHYRQWTVAYFSQFFCRNLSILISSWSQWPASFLPLARE